MSKNQENSITNSIKTFMNKSAFGGILLFFSAVLAVILANSSWSSAFFHFWENDFSIGFNESFVLKKSLLHWINDGLMSIFFFVVGLELKREIIGGELSNPKKAMLPIVAAIGGMAVPALVYTFFNHSGETMSGWGIPMATDIAFALGVLYLLGNKIATSLKVFLTALAIVDDLGAVLVIAFFYTSHISIFNLGIAFLFWGFLMLANKSGIRNTYFYGIVGIGGVWLFFLMSGIHSTIAAVLVAFTIPASVQVNEITYMNKINKLLTKFKNADQNDLPILTQEQLHLLEKIRIDTENAMTPLQKLEHRLHPIVTYLIMPIFAFANAGVAFTGNSGNNCSNSVVLGVTLGLLIGKSIGVIGSSILLVKLKIAQLPQGITFRHLVGIGFLASIGFTMSLFISNLAFQNPEHILQAKIGIFVGSIIGGLLGFLILKYNKSNAHKYEQLL